MGVFLLDGLVAYYDFEAGNPIADKSVNGHDLVWVGTGPTIEVGGKLGNRSRGTQNTSNYARTAAHHADFHPGDDGMTFTAWVNIPNGTLTINHPIFAHYNNAGDNRGWVFWGQNSSDEFAMTCSNNGSSDTTIAWGTDYVVDTWYFVVGFIDTANNRIGIEVNRGTTKWAALTAPYHNPEETLDHHFFHASSDIAGGARVDEAGIWKRILLTEELDALYNSGGTPPAFSTFESEVQESGSRPSRYYYWNLVR